MNRSLISLNEKNFFSTLLTTKGHVLLWIYAPWCKPCAEMQPEIDKLATYQTEEITIFMMDISQSEKISVELMIWSIPTTILFLNGQEISRVEGYFDESALIIKMRSVGIKL